MLRRKMIRDIKDNKLAYLACIFVISIGLMVFTSMAIVFDNLNVTKETFYNKYNFADGFATVKAFPINSLNRISEIEGIQEVQGRIVKDVRVLMPDRDDNIYLRLISFNSEEAQPLNGVELISGAYPRKNRYEIMVGSKFLEANNLKIGQDITLIINGKSVGMTISGSGQSPEYVYAVRNLQNIYPDPRKFEVGYVSYDVMQTLFSQKGLINDISFKLSPGFEYDDVEKDIETALGKYGLESLISNEDQLSNMILTQELTQLEGTVQTLPILFLSISSVILYIMLKRLVEQQRTQIGTLKAFGYDKKDIMLHYLSYAWVIAVFGGVLGGVLGSALSAYMTEMYAVFFNFPELHNTFSIRYFMIGVLLSVIFSTIAGLQGTKSVLRLQPSEAMRPPAPPIGRTVIFEKAKIFWELLTTQGRMAVRNISRNKGRSFFRFVGVLFTFSIIATLWSFNDMVDLILMDEFTKVQTHDLKIKFDSPKPLEAVLGELGRRNGIKKAEPMLEVPVTLKNKYLEEGVAITGLRDDAMLYNIFNDNNKKIKPSKDGLIIAKPLADRLSVGIGDTLLADSPWIPNSPVKLGIIDVVPQYIGSNAYMEINALTGLLRTSPVVTTVVMATYPEAIPEIKADYSTSENVILIEERHQAIQTFLDLMGSYMYILYVMMVIAVITGFAIVYNTSIISLSERKREIASLRVLGMGVKEVLEVISFEQWFIAIFGIIAGIPFTYMIKSSMEQSMSNEFYSIPLYTDPVSFIPAFIGTCLSIWIAQRSVLKKIKKINIVDALKQAE